MSSSVLSEFHSGLSALVASHIGFGVEGRESWAGVCRYRNPSIVITAHAVSSAGHSDGLRAENEVVSIEAMSVTTRRSRANDDGSCDEEPTPEGGHFVPADGTRDGARVLRPE